MSLLVAHIADIHLCERVRFEGTCRVLETFVTAATSEGVGLAIVAGDLVDPRRAPARATPAERNFLARILVRLAEQCPVVVVRGNHDARGDWTFLDLLQTAHPIRYLEEPTTVPLDGVTVHAVPWLSPRWFASQVAALDLSIEDGHAWIEDAVRPIFDSIRGAASVGPGLHVGVGHLSVRGASLSSGQALVGGEMQVGADTLSSLGLDYFGLGHLHERQEVAPGVWYSGSPNRLDFGEAEKDCGWNLVTVSEFGPTLVEFFELPADKLLTVDAEVVQLDDGMARLVLLPDGETWIDPLTGDDLPASLDPADDSTPLFPDDVADTDVRLRVLVPEGLHAEDQIAELVSFITEHGGRPVVERITVAANRSRAGASEIASSPSIAEKVGTYLTQRDHDKKQIGRVLDRLEALEEAGA